MEETIMIGQHKRDFTVVPYQSSWKDEFQRDADLLQRALGEKALRIEHVGSTAVPGIAAKAIIDMMVTVVSLTQAKELIPVLESLGYGYRPNDTVPERMFFHKEIIPERRTHHLNLASQDSNFWKNELAFRDYLRCHAQAASEYVDLKRNLAESYARTHQIDRDGKTEFVTRILELARKEGSGKHPSGERS
jgi:GrpB-like predicted nucleotidyltransferase (UPF0157 family)